MVKFVYFDVGGVMIDDFSGNDKWQVMKRELEVGEEIEEEFGKLYRQFGRERLNLDLHVDKLMPVFEKELGMKFPEGFSWLEYFLDHFDRNEAIWPLVERVGRSCGVGLLTNMYVDMFGKIEERGLFPEREWDVVVDSTKVGAQKPEKKIYEIARERSGVVEEELLFIDNSQENVEAAKGLGWQTFLYDPVDHERSCGELGGFLDEIGIGE